MFSAGKPKGVAGEGYKLLEDDDWRRGVLAETSQDIGFFNGKKQKIQLTPLQTEGGSKQPGGSCIEVTLISNIVYLKTQL